MQATMNHTRRQLPPVAPNKRKERDETFDFLKPSTTIRPPPKLAKPKPVAPRAMAPIKTSKAAASPPAHAPTNNILLAGYLAHEFLTRGTLYGQLRDPAHPKAAPASSVASSADLRTMKQPSPREKGKAVEPELKLKPNPKPKPSESKSRHEPQLSKNQRYAQVSELLKNGAHIPGIVNPSQLARFLHL